MTLSIQLTNPFFTPLPQLLEELFINLQTSIHSIQETFLFVCQYIAILKQKNCSQKVCQHTITQNIEEIHLTNYLVFPNATDENYRNEGRYNSRHVEKSRLLVNYKYLNLYIYHLKPAKFTLYIINIPVNAEP